MELSNLWSRVWFHGFWVAFGFLVLAIVFLHRQQTPEKDRASRFLFYSFLVLACVGMISNVYRMFEFWPQVLVKELATGVWVDQSGNLVIAMEIPHDQPLDIIYAKGLDGTGFARRGSEWYRVVFISDQYDLRLAAGRDYVLYRNQNQVLCANGGLRQVTDLPVVTKHAQADCWWRHDFPGKPQPEVEFLVWPRNQPDKPRIEKWVFDG